MHAHNSFFSNTLGRTVSRERSLDRAIFGLISRHALLTRCGSVVVVCTFGALALLEALEDAIDG